ncbi:MAG: hypothetical protein WAM63_19710, partial [Rhodomicrobium sp.]
SMQSRHSGLAFEEFRLSRQPQLDVEDPRCIPNRLYPRGKKESLQNPDSGNANKPVEDEVLKGARFQGFFDLWTR